MSPHPDCTLTPALLRLLQACVDLHTTSAGPLALHLHLSVTTVRTEFQRILTALDVHDRHAAVNLALRKGWISPPSGGGAREKMYASCRLTRRLAQFIIPSTPMANR